jgi:hypothetical protein
MKLKKFNDFNDQKFWDKFAKELSDKFGETLVDEDDSEDNPYNWWLQNVTVEDIVDFVRNFLNEESDNQKTGLVAEFIAEMNKAIEMFGSYTYDDKGPDEVMDLNKLVSKLKVLSASEAGNALKELSQYNDRAYFLAETLVARLDRQPDDWFEEMLEVSGLDY